MNSNPSVPIGLSQGVNSILGSGLLLNHEALAKADCRFAQPQFFCKFAAHMRQTRRKTAKSQR
jgi:hypothetical protein